MKWLCLHSFRIFNVAASEKYVHTRHFTEKNIHVKGIQFWADNIFENSTCRSYLRQFPEALQNRMHEILMRVSCTCFKWLRLKTAGWQLVLGSMILILSTAHIIHFSSRYCSLFNNVRVSAFRVVLISCSPDGHLCCWAVKIFLVLLNKHELTNSLLNISKLKRTFVFDLNF